MGKRGSQLVCCTILISQLSLNVWRSPDRAEELIVVFNHNVINMYFTANKSTMYAYEMIMYTSFYDSAFTCLHNSSLFSNPLVVTN